MLDQDLPNQIPRDVESIVKFNVSVWRSTRSTRSPNTFFPVDSTGNRTEEGEENARSFPDGEKDGSLSKFTVERL